VIFPLHPLPKTPPGGSILHGNSKKSPPPFLHSLFFTGSRCAPIPPPKNGSISPAAPSTFYPEPVDFSPISRSALVFRRTPWLMCSPFLSCGQTPPSRINFGSPIPSSVLSAPDLERSSAVDCQSTEVTPQAHCFINRAWEGAIGVVPSFSP